jgi:hypothetical protein
MRKAIWKASHLGQKQWEMPNSPTQDSRAEWRQVSEEFISKPLPQPHPEKGSVWLSLHRLTGLHLVEQGHINLDCW